MTEELKMSEELQMVVHVIIGEMDKRFDALDKRIDRLEERMDRLEERVDRVEEDMKMYVNMLVDEMGRMETKINHRFETMDARLDSMEHEINACKLACDTNNLLMQRLDRHEIRIERLEKKSGIGQVLTVGN